MKLNSFFKKIILVQCIWISTFTDQHAQECKLSNTQIIYNYHTGNNGSLYFQSFIGGFSQEGNCNSLDYTSILTNQGIINHATNLKDVLGLLIFPDPVNSELNLQWRAFSFELNYKIYNSNGEMLKGGSIPAYQAKLILAVSDLPSGIYLIRFNNSKTIQFSRKFLKI